MGATETVQAIKSEYVRASFNRAVFLVRGVELSGDMTSDYPPHASAEVAVRVPGFPLFLWVNREDLAVVLFPALSEPGDGPTPLSAAKDTP